MTLETNKREYVFRAKGIPIHCGVYTANRAFKIAKNWGNRLHTDIKFHVTEESPRIATFHYNK